MAPDLLYVLVKALPRVLYEKYSGRETNIARGEVKCYILSQDYSLSVIFFV